MESFMTFIIVTILIFWLLGKLGRFFFRRWLEKKQREFAEQFGQGGTGYKTYTWSRQARQDSRRDSEGEVKVEGNVEKKVNGSVGDYVEFEEIKE